jgi:hypothetical protein
MSIFMDFKSSSWRSRSERSTDHPGGGTGARFALGGGVVGATDGGATGTGGVGAGVGFWASLERAQIPSAAAMKVALIILASF